MAEQYNSNSRRSGGRERRPNPSRRSDVIRCENCGEDYSVTYRRCPFCDERPGRGGASGKRVANTRGGGYGRPASALKITWWIISLAVILCAVLIIVRFMGSPIFGGGRKPNPGTSGSQNGSSSSSQQGPPDGSQTPDVETLVLSAIDITLENGSSTQLTVNLLPAGAQGEVSWSSSDPAAATVDSSGLVTNVNAGSASVQAVITASCGRVTAQCTVTCEPKPLVPGDSTTRWGTITGADTGLNIRSGPGRDYDVIASSQNGVRVAVLGEEDGWYRIRYSGTQIGYVSKDFVTLE